MDIPKCEGRKCDGRDADVLVMHMDIRECNWMCRPCLLWLVDKAITEVKGDMRSYNIKIVNREDAMAAADSLSQQITDQLSKIISVLKENQNAEGFTATDGQTTGQKNSGNMGSSETSSRVEEGADC